jgi:hypothetical protein
MSGTCNRMQDAKWDVRGFKAPVLLLALTNCPFRATSHSRHTGNPFSLLAVSNCNSLLLPFSGFVIIIKWQEWPSSSMRIGARSPCRYYLERRYSCSTTLKPCPFMGSRTPRPGFRRSISGQVWPPHSFMSKRQSIQPTMSNTSLRATKRPVHSVLPPPKGLNCGDLLSPFFLARNRV